MSIPVTKPFLPPKEEYEILIDKIWGRNWLTNNGPLVQQLEDELKNYLHIQNLNFVSNGTVALQIAIKVLNLRDEVITTPFSYVATTSSLVWEGCTPIFVDIDRDTLNIDPKLIEKAITDQTSAILATHVFGNPCDIDAIQKIANHYNLKVIYDAAHCFGSKYKGESAYNYGDISTASFHATKLFHTTEGGALITKNNELSKKISQMRNFGHAGPGNFEGVGINGKNSEFHAAMGLCNIRYIEEVLKIRKQQSKVYNDLLKEALIKTQLIKPNITYNHSYYPVIFENEHTALEVKDALEKANIFPRRYFYPGLNNLDYVKNRTTPVSDYIASSILCLPLYHELTKQQQEKVANIILNSIIS